MLPLFSSSQCLFLLNISSLYVASPPTCLLTFLASSFGWILCDFPTVLQRMCMLVSSCVYTFISLWMLPLLWGLQAHEQNKLWEEECSCDSSWRKWQAERTSSYQSGGASPSTPVGPGHTGNQQACPRGVSLSPGQGCQSHSPGTGDIKAFTTKVINSSVLFLSSPGAVLRANLRAIYLFTEYLLCLLRALLYFYDNPLH